MSTQIQINLSDELLERINNKMKDSSYASPSEYIHELIVNDLEDNVVMDKIMKGLDDVKNGRFSSKSILDFKVKE